MQTGGSALHRASEVVLQRAKDLAARLLEASPDDIVVDRDGRVGVAGVPTKAFHWRELAQIAADSTRRPDGWDEKGIGESGTMGSTPAVQNAVIDALAPFGVHHLDMPLSPERVWSAIQSFRSASSAVD
jgi:carbon-monoxide dehydrogenase large subunit